MIRVNQRERPTIKQLLELPEVKSRRQADWFKGAAVPEKGDCNLMATIAVPANMRQITNNLPKPCFADKRPNSPEAWPATDRNREGAIAAKKAGRPVPSAAANAENDAPASNAPKATGLWRADRQAARDARRARDRRAAADPAQGLRRRDARERRAARHARARDQGRVRPQRPPQAARERGRPDQRLRRSAAPARLAYGAPQVRAARARATTTSTACAAAAGHNRRRY